MTMPNSTNMYVQPIDEPVASFITALYCLVEYCEYGSLHDEMIRDQLVVGLQNAKLSQRQQMDTPLSLEKNMNMAKQSERVHEQKVVSSMSSLGKRKSSNADAIKKGQGSRETRNKNLEESQMLRSAIPCKNS